MNLERGELFGLRNQLLLYGLLFKIIDEKVRFGHDDNLGKPWVEFGILDYGLGFDFDTLQGSFLKIDYVDQVVLRFVLVHNYYIVLSIMEICLNDALLSERDGK
jgi:hypothetical protein